MKSSPLLRWIVGLCSLILSGCVTVAGAARIDVETRNRTAGELSEVVVWFGAARCTSGYLVPTAQATHMFYPKPITPQAKVEWKDEAGKKHFAVVDLRAVYQPGLSGVLQIAITDTGVEANLLPLPTSSQTRRHTSRQAQAPVTPK